MKICYLSSAESIHTHRWAQHFQGCGHQVTVITFQPGEIDGIAVLQLAKLTSLRPLNVLFHLDRIRRLVRNIAPDILHAHYVTSYGLAGAISGWRPFVATAWGDDVLISPERSLLYRLLVSWVLARADLVTSMADHMTEHMNKRGYAAPDRILTLPFGVDTDQFNPNERIRKHGDGSAIVISTRNLIKPYDVQSFIMAIPLVLVKCPETRFMVAGDGDLRASLEVLANSKGVGQYVEFLGMVPHKNMPRLLQNADVFVTTSLTDGNNISLNEGMACGAFPVASDIPANRQWIRHGINGFLFPVGDVDLLAEAIVEAIRQPGLRQEAGDQNWDIVRRKASWVKSMATIENYYHRLCSQ